MAQLIPIMALNVNYSENPLYATFMGNDCISTSWSRLCETNGKKNRFEKTWPYLVLNIREKRHFFLTPWNGKSDGMNHSALTTHTRQLQQQKEHEIQFAVAHKHSTRIDVFIMRLWNEYAQANFSPAAIMKKNQRWNSSTLNAQQMAILSQISDRKCEFFIILWISIGKFVKKWMKMFIFKFVPAKMNKIQRNLGLAWLI